MQTSVTYVSKGLASPAVRIRLLLASRKGPAKRLPCGNWSHLIPGALDKLAILGARVGQDEADIPTRNIGLATAATVAEFGLPKPFDGRIELNMMNGFASESFHVDIRFRGAVPLDGATFGGNIIRVGDDARYWVGNLTSAFLDRCAALRLSLPSPERCDAYHDALDDLLGVGTRQNRDRTVTLRQVSVIKADWIPTADGFQQLYVAMQDPNGEPLLIGSHEDRFLEHVDDPSPTGVRPVFWNETTAYVLSEDVVLKLGEVQAIRAMPPRARMERVFGAHPDVFDGFGDHVIGYGEWRAPKNAMLRPAQRRAPPEWVFAQVESATVMIPAQEAAFLRDEVDRARRGGFRTVLLDGRHIDLATAEDVIAQVAPAVDDWRAELIAAVPGMVATGALDDEGMILSYAEVRDVIEGRRGAFPPAVEKYALMAGVNLSTLNRRLEPVPRAAVADLGSARDCVEHFMRHDLQPHQWAGADIIRRNWLVGNHGVLVCDEPGTGKTPLALAGAAWLRRGGGVTGPMLYVTPSDMVDAQVRAFEKSLEQGCLGTPLVLDGRFFGNTDAKRKAAMDRIRRASVCIISYEMVTQHQVLLAQIRFGVAIYDEIQRLANPYTYLRNAVYSLNVDFRIGMTGTPVENGIYDFWSIMDIVWPGRIGSLRQFGLDAYGTVDRTLDRAFAARLCDDLMNPPVGPPVVIRSTKQDVLSWLPDKVVHEPELAMQSVQQQAYAAIFVGCRQENGRPVLGFREYHRMHLVSIHPGYNLAFPRTPTREQALAWLELSAITHHLRHVAYDVARSGEKMILSVTSKDLQARIMACLRVLHPDSYVGAINQHATKRERAERIAEFQGFEGSGFLILTPKVGGVGHTLIEASNVYLVERGWNPKRELQVMDRVHRFGQTRTVHVHAPKAIYRPDRDLSMSLIIERAHRRKLSEGFLVMGESDDFEREVAEVMAS